MVKTQRRVYYTLDKQGNPQTVEDAIEWAWWYEKSWPDRKVGQVVIPLDRSHRIFVSTVFLGLDHNWSNDDDRPILYETMVFYEEFHRPRGRGPVRTRLKRLYHTKRMLETPYQSRYHDKYEARADFDKLVGFLLHMKASTEEAPSELIVDAWCRLYDDFGFRAQDFYGSSQTENSEEMAHE